MTVLGIINFAASLQGIFLAYILINKKGDQKESRFLALLVLVVSLSILGPVMGITGYYRDMPYFIRVAEPLALLFGPLLYYYISVLCTGRLPKLFYLHLLPFILYTGSLTPFYLLPPSEKIALVEEQVRTKVPNLWAQGIRLLHTTVYILLALQLIRSLEARLKDRFSNLDQFKLRQSKHILRLYFGVAALSFAIYMITLAYPMNFVVVNNIGALSISILIYSLAYVNLSHASIPLPGSGPAEPKENTTGSDAEVKTARKRLRYHLSDAHFSKHAGKLEDILKDKHVFLNPEISLNDLSESLGIPAYQTSEVISRKYGLSFFDLINKLRIEEVKHRLADPAFGHYSVLAIAMDCGFNSKSSFNSAFKKLTGKTPSEYRKSKL